MSLQCVAVYACIDTRTLGTLNVLQYAAECCSACCSVMPLHLHTHACCNTLQHHASNYNTLQHTATLSARGLQCVMVYTYIHRHELRPKRPGAPSSLVVRLRVCVCVCVCVFVRGSTHQCTGKFIPSST